ncbi:hypothetical protein DAI43_22495, partial [Achromobacter xylosoxidans]
MSARPGPGRPNPADRLRRTAGAPRRLQDEYADATADTDAGQGRHPYRPPGFLRRRAYSGNRP